MFFYVIKYLKLYNKVTNYKNSANKEVCMDKKRKKVLLKTFYKSVTITSLIVLVCIVVSIASGVLISSKLKNSNSMKKVSSMQNENAVSKEEINRLDKNIVVFGVDKGGTRTDTIIAVNVNSLSKKISVVSVPRDTKVIWTEAQKEKARELDKIYYNEGKITDMSSLGE